MKISKIKIVVIVAILIVAGYYYYNIYRVRVQIDSEFNTSPEEQTQETESPQFIGPNIQPNIQGPGGTGLPPSGQ